jgi:hypothetical protein
MIRASQYESAVLAKGLDIFRRRFGFENFDLMCTALGTGSRKSLYGARIARIHRPSAIDGWWMRMAMHHAITGAPVVPLRPLPLPFPADPHGDHPECN